MLYDVQPTHHRITANCTVKLQPPITQSSHRVQVLLLYFHTNLPANCLAGGWKTKNVLSTSSSSSSLPQSFKVDSVHCTRIMCPVNCTTEIWNICHWRRLAAQLETRNSINATNYTSFTFPSGDGRQQEREQEVSNIRRFNDVGNIIRNILGIEKWINPLPSTNNYGSFEEIEDWIIEWIFHFKFKGDFSGGWCGELFMRDDDIYSTAWLPWSVFGGEKNEPLFAY